MKTTAVDRSVDNGLTQMFNLVNEILCSQTSEILTKQARTIKVSKVTKRHCAGTVQSQGGRVGNVKQVGFEPGSKTCRKGADVTKIRQTVPDTSSGNRKSSVTDGSQSGAADNQ